MLCLKFHQNRTTDKEFDFSEGGEEAQNDRGQGLTEADFLDEVEPRTKCVYV